VGQENFADYSISYLSPDDGLSQGSNYFRFEDSHGFMWITCNDAINRYDGKTVKVYNLDRYFNQCPNLQQGYGIVEDKNGDLYVGSVRGLYIYHRKEDRFSLQKIYKNSGDDIAMPFAIQDGKVWCYNKKYQLATYEISTKKTEFIVELPLNPLPSIHIYELSESNDKFYARQPFADRDGNFWFIAKNTILTYNPQTSEIAFPLRSFVNNSKPYFTTCKYLEDENKVYIGSNLGFLEYDLSTKATWEIDSLDQKKITDVRQITIYKNMLVLMSEWTVHFINRDQLTLSTHQLNNEYDVYKHCFDFDKSGRLWFCRDGKGQVIIDFSPLLLNKHPNSIQDNKLFSESGVSRIVEFPANKLIVPYHKLNKYTILLHDLNTNEKTAYPSPFLKKFTLYGIVTDYFRNGIWYYSELYENNNYYYELFFKNINGQKKYSVDSRQQVDIGRIQDLKCFGPDRLICASTKGLYWFYPEQLTFEKLVLENSTNAFTINVLDDNHFAVSYINKPLIIYHVDANKNVTIKKTLLADVQSYYIQKDKIRNRYWVGTNNGVYLLDKHFKTLELFNANNGLAGSYIYGLLLDDVGNAYCSHQRGLSSINATSFRIINFDKYDGIQDWDYNNRAFCKTQDGTLVFGGVSGYNYFKPPLIPKSYYHPQVYIDEILVNNVPYDLTKNADYLKKINLNHRQTTISITALVRDLDNAHNIQVIYRIKEISEKWEHIPNGSKINFSNLAPNTYTLELGVYDKYSAKEIKQKSLIIVISAPFYYELWFWLVLGILLTGITFWIYNWVKFKKQQSAFQQGVALEKQRTKIIADLHDDIGATLSSLQINSAVANQLIVNDPDEAHIVLNKIEDQSKNLADKIGDIIWSMKPGKDEFMSLGSRIKIFANDILGALEINYDIKIDPKVNFEIHDIAVRKNVLLITKEAINNVAKYSHAKQLEIVLSLDKSILHLKIEDNGIGFDVNSISGNGIQNMRKRVEELNGVLSIESSKETGTKIQATIPCP
jgi:signal transduction histidine kinase/ligand-binding sensor domain-containing protein